MTTLQDRLRAAALPTAVCALALCSSAIADPAVLWSHKPAADDNLLPVDQAFSLVSAQRGRDGIAVSWDIAPGYYLYRQRLAFAVDTEGASHPIDATRLPAATHLHDEQGDHEIYRGTLVARLPAQRSATRLRVSYQGCADAGVCYPPQNKLIDIVSTTPSPQ